MKNDWSRLLSATLAKSAYFYPDVEVPLFNRSGRYTAQKEAGRKAPRHNDLLLITWDRYLSHSCPFSLEPLYPSLFYPYHIVNWGLLLGLRSSVVVQLALPQPLANMDTPQSILVTCGHSNLSF